MKRPIAVLIVGWLFILAGTVGIIYHFSEIDFRHPFENHIVAALLVRLLAVVGGILTLRGSNFGRWLLIAWMAYHVVLSYFHDITQLVMHAIFLAIITFVLFHPKVTRYFARR